MDPIQRERSSPSEDTKSPPSYTATENPPPEYTPPSNYDIGGQALHQPFVSVEQLKAHLALLRAFKDLRTIVEEGTDSRLPLDVRALDQPALRWGRMVALAVIRYAGLK